MVTRGEEEGSLETPRAGVAMVTMKGRRGWSGKSSGESLIGMGWLPTGQTTGKMALLIF
jgi:hypothetical protein